MSSSAEAEVSLQLNPIPKPNLQGSNLVIHSSSRDVPVLRDLMGFGNRPRFEFEYILVRISCILRYLALNSMPAGGYPQACEDTP